MKTKHHPITSAAGVKVIALLLVTVSAFLSCPVRGQCPQGWNVSGGWRFKQSNQGVPNSLRLSMDGGGNISGSARYQTGGRNTSVSGSVTGQVSANDVELVISWSNGLTGIYNGKIDPQGMITGTGYEKSSPSKRVSWSSDKAMTCGQTAAPSTGHRPRS